MHPLDKLKEEFEAAQNDPAATEYIKACLMLGHDFGYEEAYWDWRQWMLDKLAFYKNDPEGLERRLEELRVKPPPEV